MFVPCAAPALSAGSAAGWRLSVCPDPDHFVSIFVTIFNLDGSDAACTAMLLDFSLDSAHPASTMLMRIDIHLHDESAGSVDRKLDHLLTHIRALVAQGVQIMAQLDTLEAQVRANTDVEASAVVLIQGIADRIAAAGVDPAKLAELTASLKASGEALATAVIENTPASE